jgi:hypothetical protein
MSANACDARWAMLMFSEAQTLICGHAQSGDTSAAPEANSGTLPISPHNRHAKVGLDHATRHSAKVAGASPCTESGVIANSRAETYPLPDNQFYSRDRRVDARQIQARFEGSRSRSSPPNV